MSERLAESHPDVVRRQAVLTAGLSIIKHDRFVIGTGLSKVNGDLMPSLLLGWSRPVVGHGLYEDGGFAPVDVSGEEMLKVFNSLLHDGDATEVLSAVQPVQMIGMPRPYPFRSPGGSVHCGYVPGTLGALARRREVDGILTAGHICPPVGVNPPRAYGPDGEQIGSVLERMCYRTDRSGAAVKPKTNVPDVAFISLENRSTPPFRGPGTVPTIGHAEEWDEVTAFGSVTTGLRAPLEAVNCSMATTSPKYGNWGEAMFTLSPIAAPGDSGAPVYNASSQLVGHVVGGYRDVITVMQDINYLLAATEAELR